MPYDPLDPDDPPPYYTVAEVDALVERIGMELVALDARLDALEGGTVDPPDPGPMPEGVDLVLVDLTAGAATVGRPCTLTARVENQGDEAVPPGDDTVIGVGFVTGDDAATWCSTTDGLPAGASAVLATDTAQWSGGPWYPTTAGPVELLAFVDDLNRIPEYDETNNQATITVVVDEAPEPVAGQLFTSDSGWNTTKAPTVFAAGADGRLAGLTYGVNNGPYSHPIAYSSSADPIHRIQTPESWGWPAQELHVPMRDDTTPAGGTDGHLCLVVDDGRMVDMWILRPTGTRAWTCAAYALHNWQSGNGWGAPPYGPSAGVTAAGAPTAAGTITAADIEAGEIAHALCMAFDYNDQGGVGTCNTPQLLPAISNDVGGGPGPLAEGALLVAQGAEPGGLNGAERALWRAASTYGCWVIDRLDGIPMFYGDRSPQVGNAFRGEQVTAIGRRLRMVKTW